MRCAALALFVAAAAAQQASPVVASASAVPSLPTIQILPLPIAANSDIASGNGFRSIAQSLAVAANALGVQADAGAITNAKLTGSASVNPNQTLDATLAIVRTANEATGTFWQLAVELERKICAIASSINQQNLAAQQASVVAAIQAQITAIARLQAVLVATVAAVNNQSAAFIASEKAIIIAAIRALFASVIASSGPLGALASGLSAVGISGITEAVNSLQAQATALGSFAASVSIVPA